MSVHPNLQLLRQGLPSSTLTLELWLDPVCPFSRLLFLTFHTHIKPLLLQTKKYHGKVQAIFRSQVQPWHPSSTITNESVMAVTLLSESSDEVWTFLRTLFEKSDTYYDSHTILESRFESYKRLTTLLPPTISASSFLQLLAIEPAKDGDEKGKNGGNKVTEYVKWHTKLGRQNGIHVTPTVCVNGIVDPEVQSKWGGEEWEEYLDRKLVDAEKK